MWSTKGNKQVPEEPSDNKADRGSEEPRSAPIDPQEDSWGIQKYLSWSDKWRNFKTGLRPRSEAAWEYYKTLPEWAQGGIVLASMLLIIASVLIVRTTIQMSAPLPAPIVKQEVAPPEKAQIDEKAESAYSTGQSALQGGSFLDAITALESVPDGYKDKDKLLAEAKDQKQKADEKTRFTATYQDGLKALAGGDYQKAIDYFQILQDAMSGAGMYKDVDQQIAKVIMLSQSADAEIAADSGASRRALNNEQRERKALRVYNLAFLEDTAFAADSAYRARDTLISVTNGWRSPSVGQAAVDSALEKLSDNLTELSLLKAPTGAQDIHADFLKSAGDLRDDLASASKYLSPYNKSRLKLVISRLKSDNASLSKIRKAFNNKISELDAAQRDGKVFTGAEIETNLNGER